MAILGYPDLPDPEFVFEALLGHGMFAKTLPPCFSSEEFLRYTKNNLLPVQNEEHAYIGYRATRNISVPRQLAIPHPLPYWYLCNCIMIRWCQINEHIGKPKIKFNFCHVRRINNKEYIFEMNYNGPDKWSEEELKLDYSLDCNYLVQADIATCFPSIYSHSIPWSVCNKEWAKSHKCTSWNKDRRTRIQKGVNCKNNGNLLCGINDHELWPNDLDARSRSIKDGETNGLLIGPHTSNIISEILLTRIDDELQKAGYTKIIRHIDDYEFFARDEAEARGFLKTLESELKKYELSLNSKKTRIISYAQYISYDWISQLHQFSFPDKKQIGFTTVNAFIDFTLKLSEMNGDYAPLKYAIKIIANKVLSRRAQRLYIMKILKIAIEKPYFLPQLEEYVFIFAGNDFSFLGEFLRILLFQALEKSQTDSIAFAFYFAIKYGIKIQTNDWKETKLNIIALDDCISTVLAYKYCKINNICLREFHGEANKLLSLPDRDQDKHWLFLYEILSVAKLPSFLKKLKKANVSFWKGNNFV